MDHEAHYIHRTYEPFKFLSRLTLIPLRIARGTKMFTQTVTHEAEEPYRFAPTLVVKAGPLPFGIGIGWWLDGGLADAADRQEEGEEDIEYNRYVAVNGHVDREKWQTARRAVARQGLSPDEEMEVMQAMGIFE